MFKHTLLTICISLATTALSLFVFSKYFQRTIIETSTTKATQVAEHSVLFSNKLSSKFNAAIPNDFTEAAESSRKAVVFIEGELNISDDTHLTRKVSKSTGSGVLISNDGYIVTNNHVIANAKKIRVTLNDKREYKATLIGNDEETDLALLKIEATTLPYLVFGNSDSLRVGEWVLAVGNPFRLQSTVTAGIVSAKARTINILEQKGIESFIQTDAAVNPGNSGGALIDTRGSLVGINTAILSNSGGYEGFSFAIPANLARKIVRDLKTYGVVQRGWMGVTINGVDASIAEELNLNKIQGVFVDATTKNGAAREAGIQRSDVIIEINTTPTNTVAEFMEQLGKHSPSDKLTVKYVRNGRTNTTQVVLRNQLNSTDYVAVRKDKILTELGFELRDLDSLEKSKYGKTGVHVVSVYKNSTVGKVNLEPGYVITTYNGNTITDVATFIDWLNAYNGTVVLEGFYENYPGNFPYTFNVE